MLGQFGGDEVVERNGGNFWQRSSGACCSWRINFEVPSAATKNPLWRIFSTIRCARAPVIGVAAAPFSLEQGRAEEAVFTIGAEISCWGVRIPYSIHHVSLMKRSRYHHELHVKPVDDTQATILSKLSELERKQAKKARVTCDRVTP
jgi:hypothetical protein